MEISHSQAREFFYEDMLDNLECIALGQTGCSKYVFK